jgi:hypothetical protein
MQLDSKKGFNIPDMMEIHDLMGLADDGKGDTTIGGEQQGNKKIGNRKKKWGPILAERRSTRIRNDGRTSMEKAKDKKKEDLEDPYKKGKKKNLLKLLLLRI